MVVSIPEDHRESVLIIDGHKIEAHELIGELDIVTRIRVALEKRRNSRFNAQSTVRLEAEKKLLESSKSGDSVETEETELWQSLDL